MATRIVVLERAEGSPTTYTVIFWLAVPVARQPYYANASAKSRWKSCPAGDLAALASGSVLEVVDMATMAEGATEQDVAADLEARWTTKQAALDADLRLFRYGTTWDGAAWAVVTA